jgi:hypothetical protein
VLYSGSYMKVLIRPTLEVDSGHSVMHDPLYRSVYHMEYVGYPYDYWMIKEEFLFDDEDQS